jgi:serine protease Do
MRIHSAIGSAIAAVCLAMPGAVAQTVHVTPGMRNVQVVNPASPYLGIGVKDIDSDSAKRLNLKEVRGVEITQVEENSPAAKAGIQAGDVVLEYNGQPVEGGEQLSRFVRETPVGRQVKVGVWRNGSMQTLTATVEAHKGMIIANGGGAFAMPDMEQLRNFKMPEVEMPSFSMTYQSPVLGIMGESLGPQEQLADFFGVKDGVLVKSVTKNSAAEKAGIKAGDVIVKVDDTKVSASRDITRALRDAKAKKSVTVTVVRAKKEMPITVTIETATAMGWPVHARILRVGYSFFPRIV